MKQILVLKVWQAAGTGALTFVQHVLTVDRQNYTQMDPLFLWINVSISIIDLYTLSHKAQNRPKGRRRQALSLLLCRIDGSTFLSGLLPAGYLGASPEGSSSCKYGTPILSLLVFPSLCWRLTGCGSRAASCWSHVLHTGFPFTCRPVHVHARP